MVIVKDIDFFSMCEHPPAAVFGKCHGAICRTRKSWASARFRESSMHSARRLQVQERLTVQIAETLKRS